MKDLLAIPKHNSIILYGSDPPYHPIKDIFWLLNQPTVSMNIYVSSIDDMTTSRPLRIFSSPPAKRSTESLSCTSSVAATTGAGDRINMSLNVAGLEAALAKTRQFCNELNHDVKNSVKEFNTDAEINQLLSLANSIVTDLQGRTCGCVINCIFQWGYMQYLIIS